jgi:hypothetical protein
LTQPRGSGNLESCNVCRVIGCIIPLQMRRCCNFGHPQGGI